MGSIVPAIIPTSRKDLEQKLKLFEGVCDDVQVDIVDGRFAKPASWPYIEDSAEPARMLAEGTMLPDCGEFRFEIDLMSEDPESSAGQWIGLCASRVVIHAESTRFLGRFLGNTRVLYGHEKDFAPSLLSFGLAIGAATDMTLIEPHLDKVEYVQFMGIRSIGKQGEPFDMGVLARIKAFRKKYPNIPVQIDGGVNATNAPALLDAGVSRLVVGSAIWKSADPVHAYRELHALTERYGLYG